MNGEASTQFPGTGEEGAIRPLVRAIRAHRLLVAGAVLAALAGAIAYLAVRTPAYEATTNVLVNPLPQEDQVFLGLDLLRDSGDATRTVQTAATLLETQAAADRTAEALGGGLTGRQVLDRVSVDPLGESNIVGVTATADDGREAAQLADEFTNAALAARTQELDSEVQAAIRRAETELRSLAPGSPSEPAVTDRLSRLRSIADTGDPTRTLQQSATAPRSPTGAGPVIVLPLALIAGFALGAGGALLRELVDRRIGDAEEAFAIYPVPVLARVPILSRKDFHRASGTRWHVPAPVRQPFQSLVVQLEQRPRRLGTILVTSPSKGDGKTTSSINLAVSLAATGRRVVLIDGDLRHPRIAPELGLEQATRQADIALPGKALRDLLVRPSRDWQLHVLAVAPELDDPGVSEAALRRIPRLLEEASAAADVVVIDTPPLGEVSDALRLLPRVDDLLLVIRIGNTLRAHLESVRELLDRGGHQAEGCVMLDSADRAGAGYMYGSYGQGRGAVDDLVLGEADGDHQRTEPAAEGREPKSSWAGS